MRFDLSGIRVRVHDPDPTRAARLRVDWAAFATGERGSGRDSIGSYTVEVRQGEVSSPAGPYRPKEMRARFSGPTASFSMAEGEAEANRPGEISILLHRATEDRPYFTMMNLIRAGLAWCLAEQQTALIHAAGLVVGDRGFALAGPEGSGKSTWAVQGEIGGAQVLSDDLLLVDASGRGPHLLGAPFRSTYRKPLRPGRWPLACWLSPEHADPTNPAAKLLPLNPLIGKARLAANLTFVAEALERDSATAETLEALGRAPFRSLRFARNPDFLPVLDSFRDDDG